MKAIEIATGREIQVSIDKSYADKGDGTIPVKFPESAWVKNGSPGTWYVNKEGYVVAGLGPDGYNGRFMVLLV